MSIKGESIRWKHFRLISFVLLRLKSPIHYHFNWAKNADTTDNLNESGPEREREREREREKNEASLLTFGDESRFFASAKMKNEQKKTRKPNRVNCFDDLLK